MSTESWYELGVGVLLVGAALTAFFLHFITAPYGRHYRGGFGPDMDARMSWVVMESPAVLVFGLVYFRGAQAWDLVPLVLFGLWQAHYLQRTFVFPFLMRLGRKRSPLLTVTLGLLFNTINGAVNAVALSHGPVRLTTAWLWVPRFLLGALLFGLGYVINRQSDAVLRSLRRPGETGYRMPHGGLFQWVTSPNYLGEMIEWIGWALASWSLAGVAFACFTAANLVPRARAHHRWYREKFPDYPPQRKALVPGIF